MMESRRSYGGGYVERRGGWETTVLKDGCDRSDPYYKSLACVVADGCRTEAEALRKGKEFIRKHRKEGGYYVHVQKIRHSACFDY